MQITPITGPLIQKPEGASPKIASAVEAFNRNSNSQREAVRDPNNVSPEELSAVKAPTESVEGQSGSNEDTTKVVSEEAKTTEDRPLSSQYAALARKEKALRAKEQQLRQREAALKPEPAKEAAKAPTIDESKYISRERLAQDPFSVLAELGLSYDDLTNKALNAPKPEDIQRARELQELREEIKALKGITEKTEKSIQDSAVEGRKQAVNEIRNQIKSLVSTDDAYETIKETNSISDVVELIERTFDQDGYLMTVEEAAQAVEDHLVEEAMKITKIKKIQQRLQTLSAPKAPATSNAKSTVAPQQTQMKTLTNSVSSTRQLSAKERALLAFRGELK